MFMPVQAVMKDLEEIMIKLRVLARRHWQRALKIREKLRFSEETFHLVMAGGVGVVGGLVNLVYHQCIELSQLLFTHRLGEPVEVAKQLPTWALALVPTIGGLVAGLVLYFGLRLVGKQRSTNILEVVATSDGRLPFRSGIVKACSSLVSIGSGMSIGREGGITQLSATFASKWGQLAKWHPYRLRLMTACGAASGISAAYDAPITGAVFAALIVLGNFSMNMFGPLVFSSVVAAMVSRSFFGLDPLYVAPEFKFVNLTDLPWFLVLGILTGTVGSIFLKLLQTSQNIFKKLPGGIYVRMLVSGAFVGLILLQFPGVWGNGFGTTNEILHSTFETYKYPILFVIGLLLAKLFATVAAVGSGAVGGVITPTLFLGSATGWVLSEGLRYVGQGSNLPTGVFALVGMGSMLAATTRSPLLAMIMILEIAQNYSIMPGLMLACVMSTVIARRLHPESIYTEPLRSKGLMVDREVLRPGSATEQTVGDLMRAPVPPVRDTASLQEIAERFLVSPNNFLPVVDAKYQLIGAVALQDLKEYLNAGSEILGVIAADVMRPPPMVVTPTQLLLDTLPVMLASELRNVPVVNSYSENRLVGSVVRAEVLGLLSEAIATKAEPIKPPAELSTNGKEH